MDRLKMDYNHMMMEFVGKAGISTTDLDALAFQAERAVRAMEEKRQAGQMDWRDLPYQSEEILKDILQYVSEVKDQVEAFVVLGIGGSALGPIAVQQAINHPFYNELPREKRGGYPRFYVADNVDPERLSALFDVIDVTKCLFNCISKSGSTSETMSQFMIIKEMLEERLPKEEVKNHIVCTTDAEKGNLVKIAKEEGYRLFVVPAGVGGRFSELTPVGLLPAAMCGIDIRALLAGAAEMDRRSKEPNWRKNLAFLYGALHYLAMRQGKNISVMMPYADSLKYIADWYAQLWAESLGKRYDNEGHEVFVGQTPVKALGVTDQHSQVQLYTEGPFDKVVVLLGVEEYKTTLTIPKLYQDIPSLGFLGGVTQNQLIQTEQMATEYALL